jgi:pimeloyl-ACP methyl ester carboxylesterase
VRAAVALLGAKRVMTPPLRRRLELSGLTWAEMAPVLARIRTIEGWAREWGREAAASEAGGDCLRAAAQAFLGQLVLSPYHPRKAEMQATLRRCHLRAREEQPDVRVERLSLLGGRLTGLWERPNGASRPPILLMPPLASTKEELAVLADPLLAAGHPVLRLDLPGQGESPAPLGPDAERLLAAALDEMGFGAVFAGGISLGAFYALRLAAADRRVRGVFGVSPPAFTTPADWARQPEVIWQYLDVYFATETRAETRRRALGLTLDGAGVAICCPVLLFHGARDRINPPDADARCRAALPNAALASHRLPDRHACLLHLRGTIGPQIASWCAAVGAGVPDANQIQGGPEGRASSVFDDAH